MRFLSAALILTLGACTSVESSHWNLYQLHEPDGRPRRVGDLRNVVEQSFQEFISGIDFRVPVFDEIGNDEGIEDPLGRCLHNLNGLLGESPTSLVWRTRQVNMITWLSEGCTYSLSRERCALVLGPLGKYYGVTGPDQADESLPFVTPEELQKRIANMLQAASPESLTDDPERTPVADLASQCQEALAVNLDRNGARRFLLSVGAILQRSRPETEGRDALVALELRLGKKCLSMALKSAIEDPSSIVRSAGLRSWIMMTEGLDSRPYSLAFASRSSLNIQVATAGFSAYGIPGLPVGREASQSSEDPQAAEKYWVGVLTQLLDTIREGPGVVALCHGMSQITGLPENLRAEYWIALQLDQVALFQNVTATP